MRSLHHYDRELGMLGCLTVKWPALKIKPVGTELNFPEWVSISHEPDLRASSEF